MMRWFLVLGWLVLAGCDCQKADEVVADDGLTIRCYFVDQVQVGMLYREAGEERSYDDVDGWMKLLSGEVFESRFLRGEGERGECTEFIGEVLGGSFEGRAIYDFVKGALVVKGTLTDHGALHYKLSRKGPRMIRTEVRISQGGEAGEAGKKGEEVFRQSSVALPGMAWKSTGMDGLVEISGAGHISQDDPVIESRTRVVSKVAGMAFELSAGYASAEGVPRWLGDVWEKGKKVLKVEVVHERVFMNGASLYDWVLTEESGRRPGFGTRPIDEVEKEFMDFEDGESVRRVWEVFPSFWKFLGPSGTSLEEGEGFDPFAGGLESDEEERLPPPFYVGDDPELMDFRKKGALDLKGLFEENGVAFRSGDSALMVLEPPTLFVQVSKVNSELIDGIITAGTWDPAHVGFCEVMVVESDGALVGSEVDLDEVQVLRRGGVVALESGYFKLGDNFEGTVAVRPDYGADLLNVKVKVESGDAREVRDSVDVEVNVREGRPTLVTRSFGDGKWRGLVVRAWGRAVDREMGSE